MPEQVIGITRIRTTVFTQPCQPLESGIRGSSGLVSIVASENGFCKNSTSKNTITTIDSEGWGSFGRHKHSLDQGSRMVSLIGNAFQSNGKIC